MAKTDQANNIGPVLQIIPHAHTATVTPANGVNLQGYEGCTFIISTGTITDGTWTITFQESDEAAANFVTIAADDYDEKLIGDIPGPFTNAGMDFDNQIYKVGYIGNKQYVRIVVTETVMGTAEFSACAILGDPHSAPVATGFA
jgi:hypothetical protein